MIKLCNCADSLLSSPAEGEAEEEHRAGILDLYGKMRRGRKVVDDEADRRVAVLKLSGITRTVEGCLQVRNRIYEKVFDRRWIAEQMPDAELRRQKAAYRRGLARALSGAAVVVALIATLALAAWRNARTAEAEARRAQQSLVQMNVATGLRLVEQGDPFQALLWFAAALRLDPEHEAMHRVRFATTLRQCPRLVQMWKDIDFAAFSADGDRLVTARDDEVQEWDTLTGEPLAPPVQHPGKVVALSPDGRLALVALPDQKAQVREAITAREVSPPFSCRGAIKAAVFSADGLRVGAVTDEDEVQAWEAATGKPLAVPPAGKVVGGPDGRRAATIDGSAVQLWDLSIGKATASLSHGAEVINVTFSPDGSQLATFGYSGAVRMWNAATGRFTRILRTDQQYLVDAQFSPDGHRLITGGQQVAQIWDVATGRKITPPLRHASEVRPVLFSPDGRRVATASADETVRIWDAATGEPVTPSLQQDGSVSWEGILRFSLDGRRLLTVAQGAMQLWDLATADLAIPPLMHHDAVYWAAFSQDGRRLVTTSSDGTARVWDASTGRPITAALMHRSAVNYAEFSPDGQQVVTASCDGTARVWNAATGEPTISPLKHPYEVVWAEFSPNGQFLVTACGYGWWSLPREEGEARVWEAASGKLLRTFKVPGGITMARFSPDGGRVAVGGGRLGSGRRESRVWDLDTGRPVTPPLEHKNFVFHVSFSPDGRRLLTSSNDHTARVWDLETGQQRMLLEHRHAVTWASFSPDGRRIVTACNDGHARVWDAETGRLTAPLLPHRGLVWWAEFGPDGERIATACADGTARMWDAATGEPVTPPLAHSDVVAALSFSPDGQRLVTTCAGTAQVWNVSGRIGAPEELQRLAQVLSGYRLTRSSRQEGIEPEARYQEWETLAARTHEDRDASLVAARVWHLRQAQECEKAGQWAGVLNHLGLLLPDYPAPGPLYASRARVYASLSDWQPAGADFAQSFEMGKYDLPDGYRLALTQLGAGKTGDYHRTCSQLMQRWGSTEDPVRAALLAWVGALASSSGVDASHLVALAEKAVANTSENGDLAAISAAVLYRLGRYDRAVRIGHEAGALRAAGKTGGGLTFLMPAWSEAEALRAEGEAGVDTLFLAMAHHRLGQREEARRLLAEVEAKMEAQAEREARGEEPLPWEVRVAYDLLHREAAAVIRGR